MGIGACFLVNTILPFCSNWYDNKERPLSLSILAVANILGGGFGNFIPIFFVDPKEKDPLKIIKLVRVYNISITIVWGVLTVLNFLFFKGKPDHIDETHNKSKK